MPPVRSAPFTRQRPLLAALALMACLPLGEQAIACDNGVAVISGGTTYPPLSWRKGNALVGSTIDMVKQILAEVGITARADEGGPWKRVLYRAREGEVDILVGVRKSPEREHFLLYVDPPITPSVQGVFMSTAHPFAYRDWKDLEGKTGSITLGTNFDDGFDVFAKEHLSLQAVRKVEQNFIKLDKGRVDYVLGPLVPTQLYLQKYGFDGKIVNATRPLLTIQEYLAISRKSPCIKYATHLRASVKHWVETDKINDLMEDSFVKWFQDEGGAPE